MYDTLGEFFSSGAGLRRLGGPQHLLSGLCRRRGGQWCPHRWTLRHLQGSAQRPLVETKFRLTNNFDVALHINGTGIYP